MRIGIGPFFSSSYGGIYQYSLNMVQALDQWKGDGCDDEFVVFAHEIHNHTAIPSNGAGWTVKPLQPPIVRNRRSLTMLRRIVAGGPHRKPWMWLRRRLHRERGQSDPYAVRSRPEISQWFHRCGVELMLYPWPHTLSFEAKIPYVMAIHDLQHRLQPEFPEISANGEWEEREYLYRNGTRYATLLLAESEVGKEDILDFYGPYGITPNRVKILPYLPACYLEADVSESERQHIRPTYHLPERYLFYPAQFWPHKNHARIVQALGLLRREHRIEIPIVFCGSHTGEIRERTFREVMDSAHQMSVEDQIYYLGLVPDEDMSGLYAEAVALVMPTFFGPSNIPVLEAWFLGCPVLTSDIRGIREQAGDAAVLVAPHSVEAISHGIYRLWTDEDLRRTLVDRARQRLATYTPDDYRKRLIEILEAAKALVRSERPRRPNW